MERNKKFRSKKKRLIDYLITNKLLKDKRLIKAFIDVPLEDFIPEDYFDPFKLYEDIPNLFYYQNRDNYRTISAPHMITIMLQGLALESNDDLLILGAKSGYIASLAHKLSPNGEIIILEANSEIAQITTENLKKLNLDHNIEVIVKNPLVGMPELSPWQKILVTGAITQDRIYPLLTQLDPDEGVLYAPIGGVYIQTYTQILRIEDDYYGKKQLQVRFTPLMTQIELGELELITDFDEIEIKDDPLIVDNTLNKVDRKYGKKVSIKYTSNILDNIELEPISEKKSIEPEKIGILLVHLENILRFVVKLRREEDVESCFDLISAIEAQIEKLKVFKKTYNLKIKRMSSVLNQIRTYLIVRKELEKREVSKVLDKKLEIIKKQMEDLKILSEIVEEEIRLIREL